MPLPIPTGLLSLILELILKFLEAWDKYQSTKVQQGQSASEELKGRIKDARDAKNAGNNYRALRALRRKRVPLPETVDRSDDP